MGAQAMTLPNQTRIERKDSIGRALIVGRRRLSQIRPTTTTDGTKAPPRTTSSAKRSATSDPSTEGDD